MTPEQIHQAGIEALVRALGPAGMIRFIQKLERGRGDYTAERHEWLKDVTLEELIREAQELDAR